MKRMVIIGAGVAGSVAARISAFYGWDPIVIDPNPEQAASRCALATIRPQWLGDNGRKLAQASWRWYERWGMTITQNAMVSTWRQPGARPQRDWWLVDPLKVLVEPLITSPVTGINGLTVTTACGLTVAGDAILTAVGAHDTNLFPGFRPMAGCTLYNTQIRMTEGPLRVHHLRPFHALTVAQQGNTVILGSSIARQPEAAEQEVWRMLHVAEDLGIVPQSDAWTLRAGTRATSPEPVIPQPGNPVATIGNLSRSGYGITPAVVEQWITSLPC